MKMQQKNETDEELLKEFFKCDDDIRFYNEKVKLAKYNKFEFKLLLTLINSVLAYIVLMCITTQIIDKFGISLITNLYSAILVPTVIMTTSVTLGLFIKNMLYKVNGISDKLHNFSSVKTESKRLEEQFSYEIELDKAINRKLALKKACHSVHTDKVYFPFFSKKYMLNEESNFDSNKQEEEKLKELSIVLDEKKEELDIASMRKTISDKFANFRVRKKKILIDILISSIFSILVVVLNNSSIFLLANEFIYDSMIENFVPSLIPLVAGATTSGIYLIKRDNDYLKVFNDLNSKLGENCLSSTVTSVETESLQFEREIQKKIDDVCIATLQFERQERELERITDGNEDIVEDANESVQPQCDSFEDLCLDSDSTLGRSLVKSYRHKT